MAAKKQKPSNSIIHPTTRAAGETHILEALFESKDTSKLPILKSVGFAQLPKTRQWVSYVMETQGSEILKISVEEPNVRQIAEESTKINFVEVFANQEF